MEINGKQTKNAWRILILLFFANLLNFFDRTIPAIIIEPIRHEWNLTDLQLGVIGSAFTIIYAMAGIPLGRLADTGIRKKIMGWGLAAWSAFTAINGLAWNYTSFVFVRMAVGIGEASYAPAANSLIGDLFPAHKRARAMGIFMLGLPLGLVLAFFTVGATVKAFGTWRAPFFIAAIPGILLAVFLFFIKEPPRGAAEAVSISDKKIDRPIYTVMKNRTMWWIILSGLTFNFAAYSVNTFLVSLLQRYFHISLTNAAVTTGFIVGITGLVGLTVGGWIADKIHQKSERGRLLFGAINLLISGIAIWYALSQTDEFIISFAILFALGWLASYNYYTCVYPAIQDVIEPRLRATAMALYFAAMYLLGGAAGPAVVGWLSDYLARAAMVRAGAIEISEQFKAIGLHDALYLIPIMVFATAAFVFLASRSFPKDAANMKRDMSS
ncbi:transporter, major facilitator family protein [Leptospira broomii serovar Hurstbridge str. 5399]|uniref:Transporter, major facilitator family protein n=1 Tax=Leptospira broomii serovar Hurstbridge str. 5399 TaxID=1049789 RepID=T0F8V2_9LEPT|nr:MFS transporter [Leptospira broomii]EQA44341.1 transporter, major facilitator family protein [Leptospira broomii serovar Hurstbridge str. 5399]